MFRFYNKLEEKDDTKFRRTVIENVTISLDTVFEVRSIIFNRTHQSINSTRGPLAVISVALTSIQPFLILSTLENDI